MKHLLLAFCVVVFGFGTAVALADATDSDTKLIKSMSGIQPMTPAETAQAKADRDAAKAKWVAMMPPEQDAVKQSMQSKRLADLTYLERQGENDMLLHKHKTATAKAKADYDTAKAKFVAMTPDEQAAVRKAAQQKKLAELSTMESVAEEDSMARYLSF